MHPILQKKQEPRLQGLHQSDPQIGAAVVAVSEEFLRPFQNPLRTGSEKCPAQAELCLRKVKH